VQRREQLEEENQEEFFEYEPASDEEEEKMDHDYNYEREEFLNPIIIKLPDGTLNIGTESRDRSIKECLCWNCKSRLLYKHTFNQVICYQCHEVVETQVNNNPEKVFVKCLNCE
jgi:hypothetical protein